MHAKNISRKPRVGKDGWDENWATRQGPQNERQGYSSSPWLHGDQEPRQACEEVEALHYRWSAAVEERILKSCELGCKEACRGRGTVLKTRTVPIVPRVAKDESHAGAGEAKIGQGWSAKFSLLTSCGALA